MSLLKKWMPSFGWGPKPTTPLPLPSSTAQPDDSGLFLPAKRAASDDPFNIPAKRIKRNKEPDHHAVANTGLDALPARKSIPFVGRKRCPSHDQTETPPPTKKAKVIETQPANNRQELDTTELVPEEHTNEPSPQAPAADEVFDETEQIVPDQQISYSGEHDADSHTPSTRTMMPEKLDSHMLLEPQSISVMGVLRKKAVDYIRSFNAGHPTRSLTSDICTPTVGDWPMSYLGTSRRLYTIDTDEVVDLPTEIPENVTANFVPLRSESQRSIHRHRPPLLGRVNQPWKKSVSMGPGRISRKREDGEGRQMTLGGLWHSDSWQISSDPKALQAETKKSAKEKLSEFNEKAFWL